MQLKDAFGRDDRPVSLSGPLVQHTPSTWVAHLDRECRARSGEERPLAERAVVAGCPLCANTSEVAEAVRLLRNLEWNRESLLDELEDVRSEEGDTTHTLARMRLSSDPAWRKPVQDAAWEDEESRSGVARWVDRVATEAFAEVFEDEAFGKRTQGEVTVLVPVDELAALAPRSVVARVPHRVLARNWSAYALVSLDEDEVAELEEPSRRRRATRAVRTRVPVEELLSAEYEEVWPLVLEVLEGREGEGLDLDEILAVVRKVLAPTGR